MEPCWGMGQGQLGVFERETESEIEAETEGVGGSWKEGKTGSQRSEGQAGRACLLLSRSQDRPLLPELGGDL